MTAEANSVDCEPIKNNGSTPAKNGKTEDRKQESDSTEIDPCLNKPEYEPKKVPLYEKWISSLQIQTGLTRKWVLVLGSLVLFCAALVLLVLSLVMAWPKLPHMFGYRLCRSPSCLRAASQVQENLNTSISPCENLFDAVCSQFTKNATPPLDRPVWNLKEKLVLKELERIRNTISTLELPLHPGTVAWKLKHFYEGCMDVDTIGIDGTRPLTKIISELGGWYIMRDWTDINFNGMVILTKLHVRYGVSPFFKIHVAPDPRIPNAHSIVISPSGLGLPERDYYFRDSDDKVLLAYMDYIRDVVISLSSTRNEAAKFAKDIFNYEKRIAEITPDSALMRNPIKRNSTALEHLKMTTGTIPFYDILQEMYPEVTIADNTEVIVTSQDYLDEVAQIISSTDRRTMNGYLIWTLVRQYLPFLSEVFTSSVDSFHSQLYGVTKTRKRWEVCAGLVREYMPLAVENYLEQAQPISYGTRQSLSATFNVILSIVKEELRSFDRSPHLQVHLADKLKGIKLYVGLPENVKTEQFLRDFYGPLRIIKLNFFEGVQSAVALRRSTEEKMLLNTLPEGLILGELLGGTPQVKYIPSMNAVVVPRSLLTEPFTEVGYPRPIFYGRLGTEIAFSILSAILPYGSFWTSERNMLSPFHTQPKESLNYIDSSVTCFSGYLQGKGVTISHAKITESALLLVKEVMAVRISNKALSAEAAMESHVHYSGVEQYEESSLYFLSYAQILCEVSTSQYDLFQSSLYLRTPAKLRMEVVWTQLPEMRKAFDCPGTGSKGCLTGP